MSAACDQVLALCLTDIEGSTRLWQQSPERMPEVLLALDDAVERAASPRAGEIVKSRGEGDSHFVVFRTASAAVEAAADLQRGLGAATWPGDTDVRVRVALHAGEVERRDGDYAGIAIAHTARLRSTAHGGQIVASRAIAELAGDRLDRDLWLQPVGRHRILDLPGWTEVFQVSGRDLARDFPPLVTLDTGLPPLSTIVFADAVALTDAIEPWTVDNERSVLARLMKVFTDDFNDAGGQYLKLLGDGCLALFADPDAALAFARAARADAQALTIDMRVVVHLGRVEFAQGEPVCRAVHVAAKLLRNAPTGRVALSSTARALFGDDADLVAVAEPG
jgi:class 3 adenylate cyclase